MKKLALLFSMIVLVFMSCSSDDDNGGSSDQIIGTWKFSKTLINGVEEESEPCDTEEALVFASNGNYTESYYEEEGGVCEFDGSENGTWEKSGDVYNITIEGDTDTLEITFEGNIFYTETEISSTETYRTVYERQ